MLKDGFWGIIYWGWIKMTDRELLELIATQVGVLTKDMSDVKDELGSVKNELGNVKDELNNVKRIVLDMENNHDKKLTALFDGYVQHTEQLDRIEKEVSKHEEIILRRVR